MCFNHLKKVTAQGKMLILTKTVNQDIPLTNTLVAPLAKGPYVMYEWPVIQPMSAVHQYTSSEW